MPVGAHCVTCKVSYASSHESAVHRLDSTGGAAGVTDGGLLRLSQ